MSCETNHQENGRLFRAPNVLIPHLANKHPINAQLHATLSQKTEQRENYSGSLTKQCIIKTYQIFTLGNSIIPLQTYEIERERESNNYGEEERCNRKEEHSRRRGKRMRGVR